MASASLQTVVAHAWKPRAAQAPFAFDDAACNAWGVSAEEAAKLKSELTPLGAERAGNKDGSIPAWDGGVVKPPAGWKPGQPRTDITTWRGS